MRLCFYRNNAMEIIMKTEQFVIYATGHRQSDQYSRTYVPVFDRADHARAWLTKFLAGCEHRLDGNDIILETDFTIRLRSEQWQRIMAAPIANEPVRDDVARLILRFKHGTWDEVHVREVVVDDDGTNTLAKPAPRRERSPRAQCPDGYVTITELCAASGTPAMIARAALRASGRPKPDYGWAFPPNEVPAIKKLCGLS
jgi:hypothetical protein